MKNFYIETYGCTSNKADSQFIAGILSKAGYNLVENKEQADFLIINTCAVKSVTEEKIISKLKKYSNLNKKVIVAGCLTRVNFERIKNSIPNFSAIMDPYSIHKILDVVNRIEKEESNIIEISNNPIEKVSLPRLTFSKVIDIIKISEGCLSNCTFCATKLARGKLFSYRPEMIREAIKKSLQEGFKEFYLTSEDCSAYGRDLKINLADLLNSIVKIDGKFYVRVGMMNPLHFKKFELENLIEVFKNEKIFKFLHLCVQSGSNKVLKDMKRGYTVENFLYYVEKFRKEIPEITLSTDVIVGYPSESEKDFEKTIKLIKKVKPNIVNISKFAKRPNTEAFRLKSLSSKIVKMRSKKLTKIVKKISLKENKKWLGWKGEVLVDEIGKYKNTFISRNYCYKPIVIESEENLLGKFLNVEIIDYKESYLIGKITQ